MDAELLGLERAARASPGDPELGARLARAYERAGRGAEAYLACRDAALEAPPELVTELAARQREPLRNLALAFAEGDGELRVASAGDPISAWAPARADVRWVWDERPAARALLERDPRPILDVRASPRAERAARALAEELPRLETLCSARLTLEARGPLAESGLSAFGGLAGLRDLALTRTRLNEPLLSSLRLLAPLRWLLLDRCPGLDRAGLRALSRVGQLEELKLLDAPLDAGDLIELRALEGLTRLSLVRVGSIRDGLGPLLTAGGLRRLEQLDLRNARLGPGSLMLLSGLERLERLGLEDCGPLLEEDVTSLAGLTNLRELDLNACHLPWGALSRLGQLTELSSLVLRPFVDAEGVASLARGAPPLEVLDLSWSPRVTDAALPPLGALTALTRLDLSGTAITDAGLVHLQPLKALRVVHLHDARGLTAAGVQALRGARPELQVGFRGGPP